MSEVSALFSAGLSGNELGVYVLRGNPLHRAHQQMIEGLIDAFGERHLVLLGSCNQPVSIRHLFNYEDRRRFIKIAVPNARVAPLPDFGDDKLWFTALDDLVVVAGGDPADAVYIGGSKEDVEFYYEHGRNVRIVNRYHGPTVKISASEIRDALIEKRAEDLEQYLDPKIVPLVQELFKLRWNEVRNK